MSTHLLIIREEKDWQIAEVKARSEVRGQIAEVALRSEVRVKR
jgi:hypothetical protein